MHRKRVSLQADLAREEIIVNIAFVPLQFEIETMMKSKVPLFYDKPTNNLRIIFSSYGDVVEDIITQTA